MSSDNTTQRLLGRAVLADKLQSSNQPWSDCNWIDAMRMLERYLRAVSGQNFKALEILKQWDERIFVWEEGHLHERSVQDACRELLLVLVPSSRKSISTHRLRQILDMIIPVGVDLPLVIGSRHMANAERWSWFVFNDLSGMDLWHSAWHHKSIKAHEQYARDYLTPRRVDESLVVNKSRSRCAIEDQLEDVERLARALARREYQKDDEKEDAFDEEEVSPPRSVDILKRHVYGIFD